MTKTEANPKLEIRKMIGDAQIESPNLDGNRRLKPRRGCLFIEDGKFSKPSFCFSAARSWCNGIHLNVAEDRASVNRFDRFSAAEKQKEKGCGPGAGYKQATPTGLRGRNRQSSRRGGRERGSDLRLELRRGRRGGMAHPEITSFEFRICLELRHSGFEFLPRA